MLSLGLVSHRIVELPSLVFCNESLHLLVHILSLVYDTADWAISALNVVVCFAFLGGWKGFLRAPFFVDMISVLVDAKIIKLLVFSRT